MHPRVIGPLAAMVLVAGSLTLSAGCRGNARDRKHPFFLTQKDAAAYVTEALEGSTPDQRRRAINRLSETRYITDPSVVEALALVAKTDASQPVRVAAVMGLRRSTDAMAVETALDVLAQEPGSEFDRGAGAGGPDADVRAAAVRNLRDYASAGVIPEEMHDRTVETGIRLLRQDRSRNVRLGAAQLLGYFARPEVPAALVSALDQRDFGICYEAEHSLMRLTGRTFDHDSRAWRAFLEETEDPFAERGALDDQLDPPQREWWEWNRKKSNPPAESGSS